MQVSPGFSFFKTKSKDPFPSSSLQLVADSISELRSASSSCITFFFWLAYSCFVMLCWFLLYNKVNWLYVYIYIPTLLSLSPTCPPHPTALGHHRVPSWAPCGIPQLPTSYFTHAAAAAKSLQSCLTLCDPIDGSPPGSPIRGILQARVLEWVAISFSNAWKWKVKVKSLSHVRLFATSWTAAYQAPPSMRFSRQEYWQCIYSMLLSPFILPSPSKSVLCICTAISALQIGSSAPFFWIPCICVNRWYLFFSFWLSSPCMTDSSLNLRL